MHTRCSLKCAARCAKCAPNTWHVVCRVQEGGGSIGVRLDERAAASPFAVTACEDDAFFFLEGSLVALLTRRETCHMLLWQ